MKDEEIIQQAKKAMDGDWQSFMTPKFLKILKRIVELAEKYVKGKNKK